MNSLKEVFFAMTEQDHVKEAQAQAVQQYGPGFAEVDPELVKEAQDYDTVGRIMAHNVFGDLVKEAVDEAMPYASEEDKKKEADKVVAKAKGEKSKDKDKDKDEDDEYKDKMKDKDEEGAEKQAAVTQQVLDRMQHDPEYVAYLFSKYEIG